jgi:hypothetical protein
VLGCLDPYLAPKLDAPVIPNHKDGEGSLKQKMNVQARLCDPATIGEIPRCSRDDTGSLVSFSVFGGLPAFSLRQIQGDTQDAVE